MQMSARILLSALLLSTGVHAEVPVERLLKQDIDRQDQERRERRWDEPLTTTPTPAATAMPALPAPADGPCFPVSDIMISPSGILPAKALRRLVASYEGRCLQAADLQALQQSLNSLALARGLVTTRVVIPEQNLSSGTLRLEVWPGFLEQARAASLRRRELDMALPLRRGDLLDLRALEQGIDNLNRLASFQASVELLPGEKPGASIADISVTRQRPWQAALVWDGEALEQHPSNTVRASLTLDSPLKLADRLIVGLNANLQDAEVDNAHGSSLDYDLPLGWWRFSVGTDRFEYRNPITAGLTTFVSSGESRSVRGELSRVLWRDGRHRVSMALHGKRRSNDNFIDGVTVGVSSSRLRAIGWRTDVSRVAAPWVADASVDIEDGDVRSLADPSPVDEHYARITASTRLQYHWPRSSLHWTVNAQWSDNELLPSEQLALAGHVRGFSPLSVNANTGLATRVEWAYPLFINAYGFKTLRPQLGTEYSWAPAAAGNASEERLLAVTAGMTLPWKQLLTQLQIAAPLAANSTPTPPDDWQLDASVSLQW